MSPALDLSYLSQVVPHVAIATGVQNLQFAASDLGGVDDQSRDVELSEAVRRLAEAVGLAHRTVLSPHQAEAQLAREALEALGPAVRAEMVRQLREQVQSGTYRPQPQAIAAKLVPCAPHYGPGSRRGNGVCGASTPRVCWPRPAALRRHLQAWLLAYRYVCHLGRPGTSTSA